MKSKFLLSILLAGAFLCFTIPVNAAMLSFDLVGEFSGAVSPAGTPPWGTATFDDGGGTGTVTLTMTSFLNQGTSGEHFKEWYFNLDPNLDAENDLIFNSTTTPNPGAVSFDGLTADGDGTFDFKFVWPNDTTTGFYANGDVVEWTITGTGITASSFNFLSDGGGNSPDGLLTAAHVGGLGEDGEGSGWITTPIPGALWLFASGLIGLVVIRRRIKK